jgi:aryl-alcohol dehydrogenase-like predicted oxidoreductase
VPLVDACASRSAASASAAAATARHHLTCQCSGKLRGGVAASKLDAAGALAGETGITLIQMAIAFTTRHPAVIGPRTMEHLDAYLAADGMDLSSDLLDRIDQIVPPGVTISVADNMWNFSTTALDAAFRRR